MEYVDEFADPGIFWQVQNLSHKQGFPKRLYR